MCGGGGGSPGDADEHFRMWRGRDAEPKSFSPLVLSSILGGKPQSPARGLRYVPRLRVPYTKWQLLSRVLQATSSMESATVSVADIVMVYSRKKLDMGVRACRCHSLT